jgi:hypothetical protein
MHRVRKGAMCTQEASCNSCCRSVEQKLGVVRSRGGGVCALKKNQFYIRNIRQFKRMGVPISLLGFSSSKNPYLYKDIYYSILCNNKN